MTGFSYAFTAAGLLITQDAEINFRLLQNIRVTDPRQKVSLENAIEGQAFVLRKGQKDYCLIRVSGD